MMIAAQSTPTATFLLEYELFKQSSQITGHSGQNVDQQDDGNTIADALLTDPLTDPHHECGTCDECSDHDNTVDKIVLLPEVLFRRNRWSWPYLRCKASQHCRVTGDLVDLLSSIFTFLLHLFQLRNRNGQKLDDDGRCNIRADVQCENGH